MSRNLSVFAVLGVTLMLLSILGCQGYKAPDSPTGDAVEEVEIDVSDLEDDTEDSEDFWADEEAAEEDVEGAEEATETKSAYKPVGEAVTEEVVEEKTTTELKQSPYRAIVVDENLPTLSVTEGDLVKLNVKATDADGDELKYTFDEPLDSAGRWQTRVGDAGVYYPEITVTDGKATTTKQIKIVVDPKNNKPELEKIADVTVNEGEKVVFSPRATDKDGDKLTFTYSGWMTSNTKEAGYADSGEHKVTVSVSDGISTVSQEVTVTVKDVNRAPELEVEF